jgi:hypothetical protein
MEWAKEVPVESPERQDLSFKSNVDDFEDTKIFINVES